MLSQGCGGGCVKVGGARGCGHNTVGAGDGRFGVGLGRVGYPGGGSGGGGRGKEAQRTTPLTFDWSSVIKTQKQLLLNPFQFCNECTFYPCSTLQVNGIRKPQTLPSIYIRRTLFLKHTMEGELYSHQ